MYASIDLEMSSVVESKYLSAVRSNADIARLLTYFSGRFEQIGQKHESELNDKGVFMLPLHRNFTYLMSRQLVKHYATNVLGGLDEERKAGEGSLPATQFHQYLVQSNLVPDS